MKRSLFVILVITAISISAQAKYSGGSGTAGDPYQIANADDLMAMALDINDYNKNFILTADIDLDPNLPGNKIFSTAIIIAFKPTYLIIPFTGVFNGNNHKISNLTINNSGGSAGCIGLFGIVDGLVENIGLEELSIKGTSTIGGLAGINRGTISNCYSTGTITGIIVGEGDSESSPSDIGGLVGENYTGNISNCYSKCTIICADNSWNIGGLIGCILGGGNISDCYFIGTIKAGYSSSGVGGIAGSNDGGNINNCYVSIIITGGDYSNGFGGLVGSENVTTGLHKDGNISNCYSTGTITGGDYSSQFGGLAGGNGSIVSNCYSSSSVAGGTNSHYLGGLIGSNGATISDSNSTGNVTAGDNSSDLGGLIGQHSRSGPIDDNGDINNCFSSGTVFGGINSQNIGGLVGNNYGNGNIGNCNSTGNVSGTDYVGGLVGYNEIGNINNCFSSGNVTGANPNTLGMLVGYNLGGDISTSYSTGTVMRWAGIKKCTVATGSKGDSISLSGSINASADEFVSGESIEVSVSSSDINNLYVKIFPINEVTFKNGKYKCTITNKPLKESFALDTTKSKFSFSAKNTNLTGLSCPLTVKIRIADSNAETKINETIVNGKRPIPIKLMMGVKNSLRVDKSKFTRDNKTGNITRVAVSGGFSVEDINDTNLATNTFDVTVGSQTFTIPTGKFIANKKGDRFSCSRVLLPDGEVAAATFDFNKCKFTLTIKGTKITDAAGSAGFSIDFTDFSEGAEVFLP